VSQPLTAWFGDLVRSALSTLDVDVPREVDLDQVTALTVGALRSMYRRETKLTWVKDAMCDGHTRAEVEVAAALAAYLWTKAGQVGTLDQLERNVETLDEADRLRSEFYPVTGGAS
jgi:hypothetical protein